MKPPRNRVSASPVGAVPPTGGEAELATTNTGLRKCDPETVRLLAVLLIVATASRRSAGPPQIALGLHGV